MLLESIIQMPQLKRIVSRDIVMKSYLYINLPSPVTPCPGASPFRGGQRPATHASNVNFVVFSWKIGSSMVKEPVSILLIEDLFVLQSVFLWVQLNLIV